MGRITLAAALVAASAGAAAAGGVDRSGQGISPLFEKGSYAELSFGYVDPELSGNDLAIYGGAASGDAADPYGNLGFAYKRDLGDKLSMAVIVERPWGADLLYPAGRSIMLGNTKAYATSAAASLFLRYKFSDRFSLHGGLRAQQTRGFVHLQGLAYGGLSGYSVDLARNISVGYAIGAAYEVPDIALRVAITYNSAIEHDFDTVESVSGATVATGTTKVKTPRSVNLDFQTGIAKDTLLFGSVRWVKWSEFRVDPTFLVGATGTGLINIDDTVTYSLGLGRKFTDTWSGAITVLYEPKVGDDLVSPLAPSNGKLGLTLAGIYTRDKMKITVGVNYTRLGDAMPETGTPDVGRADFKGNRALGIGVKVGFTF
jgi:long-chain fatty acid transport protein